MKQQEKVRKRQSQSCDRCKLKKRKCDGNHPCANCAKAGADCTMNVEQKKRGPKRPGYHDIETSNLSDNVKNIKNVNSNLMSANYDSNSPYGDSSMVFGDSLNFGQTSSYHSIFDNVNDSLLQFDTDFVSNFAIDPSLQLSTFVKPSKFNPAPVPSQSIQQQPIKIDPVVLNYYTQLNPKLDVQQELDLFLAATLQAPTNEASDLSIPELPGITASFYLHLISMFFTYFHNAFPLLDETVFFENLIPSNKHSQMLLSVIYAIGCRYSRSPQLYQTPFFSPQKAYSYFIKRALTLTPAPETWQNVDVDTISICQAAVLLASCDVHSHSQHWMVFGMAVRQVLRFEMGRERVTNDFLSLCSAYDKFHVNCTPDERKRYLQLTRLWWCTLVNDLNFSLTTDSDLLINEVDFTVDPSLFLPANTQTVNNLKEIPTQRTFRITDDERRMHHDKWMPFLSGFPTDSIFGASDISGGWKEKTFGLFQVGHLFSDPSQMGIIAQLSVISRQIIRYSKRHAKEVEMRKEASDFLVNTNEKVLEFHNSLIKFYENLPPKHKVWNSLDDLLLQKCEDKERNVFAGQSKRLETQSVVINLLFFATLSILHQCNAYKTSLLLATAECGIANATASFQVTSNSKATSNSIGLLKVAHQGQLSILEKAYGTITPPSITQVPPSELVGSSLIPALLIPCAMALLLDRSTSTLLTEPRKMEVNGDSNSHIISLESYLLPVLDNIGQVWESAYFHAANIRKIVERIRSKAGVEEQAVSSQNSATNSVFSAEVFKSTAPSNTLSNLISPGVQQSEVGEKSWDEIRNEFEDEFLL